MATPQVSSMALISMTNRRRYLSKRKSLNSQQLTLRSFFCNPTWQHHDRLWLPLGAPQTYAFHLALRMTVIVVIASRGRVRTWNMYRIKDKLEDNSKLTFTSSRLVSAGSLVFQWVTLGRQVTAPAEAAQVGTSALGCPRVADTMTKFRV